MSDTSLVLPFAMVVQLVVAAVYAGIMHNRVSNLKDANTALEASIKEERDKRESVVKEQTEKREKLLKEQAEAFEKKITEQRLELARAVNDARVESRASADAVRLEIQTMFQTSSELRGQRITEFTKDIEKLEQTVLNGFAQLQDVVGALTSTARDYHYRIKRMEDDRGIKRESEPRLPAVEAHRTSYTHVVPRGDKKGP